MKFYRLEFNEKQQNFHLDNFTHNPNTFGWVTICDRVEDNFGNDFCRIIEEWKDEHKTKVSTELVIRMFSYYLYFGSMPESSEPCFN